MFKNMTKDQLAKLSLASVQIVLFLIVLIKFEFKDIFWLLFIFIVEIGIIGSYFYYLYLRERNRIFSVSQIVGENTSEAFVYGQVGIVTYNDLYEITWVSDLFNKFRSNPIGKKLTLWLNQLSPLFEGKSSVFVELEDHTFEVSKKKDSNVLFFKDATELTQIKKREVENHTFIGLINVDNYDDAIQYADEQKTTIINGQLRTTIIDWAKKYNLAIRRFRADRFIVVGLEKAFGQMMDDKFNLLDIIRNEAAKFDIPITISMAISRGSDNLAELDEYCNTSLELLLARGGDQVAVKTAGQDIKFYGGISESHEKRNRVRARVVAKTLKDLILNASNIVIMGHKLSDFDSMSSSIAISRIAQSYQKKCYVIYEKNSVEEKLKNALETTLRSEINDRHNIINSQEALEVVNSKTLLIVVDTHKPTLVLSTEVLNSIENRVIIDHHRRAEDFIEKPTLVYIETSASSTTELISEMIQYLDTKVDISEIEATLMYTGIIVDTNYFRNHIGSRTFDVAGYLKSLGANSQLADDLLKDDFNEFEAKTSILKYVKMYNDNIAIAAVDENKKYSRAFISSVANSLLNVKNVEASFIIAKESDALTIASARSKGNINVQIIMENLKGGGHFNAAATQREDLSVEQLQAEIINNLEKYLDEVN